MRFQGYCMYFFILGFVFSNGTLAFGSDRGPNPPHFVAFGQVLESSNVGKSSSVVGQEAFVGLWQAIDSSDGSIQFLSVTCSHRRSCDVRLNDTAFTGSCQNQIGFAQGEGAIRGLVLTSLMTLSCSNLDGTSNVAGSQLNKFVLDRRNETLTNINDDDIPFPNVFHKISR